MMVKGRVVRRWLVEPVHRAPAPPPETPRVVREPVRVKVAA